jgi:hypothetical protein
MFSKDMYRRLTEGEPLADVTENVSTEVKKSFGQRVTELCAAAGVCFDDTRERAIKQGREPEAQE